MPRLVIQTPRVSIRKEWVRSKRVNGRLVLTENPCQYILATSNTAKTTGEPFAAYPLNSWYPRQFTERWNPGFGVKAATNFRAQVNQNFGALASVDIAERQSTGAMLLTNARRIITAARAVRRFDFKGAAKSLGMSSRQFKKIRRKLTRRKSQEAFVNNWLEYRYGWGPLMGSIDSAMHTLAEPRKINDRAIETTYREKLRVIIREGWTSYAEWTETSMVGELWMKTKAFVTCKDQHAASLSQWGFDNPLQMGWELVPFSFVVDWFTNAGDALANSYPFVGYVCSSSSNTWHYAGTIKTIAKRNPSWGGGYVYGDTVYFKGKERFTFPNFPTFPVTITFSNGLNVQRLADLLSLAAMLLSGKRS